MLLTLRPLSAFPIHDDWNGLNDWNGPQLLKVLGKTETEVVVPVDGEVPVPER
jgi:hypothetical protein